MRELLSREGFRDIAVLTDDQRGPACPTRNNILRACQQLVAGARPGDVSPLPSLSGLRNAG